MVIVIEPVLAVIGDVEILPSVVVVVSDTNSLAPTRRDKSRFLSHVRESSIVIVVIQMVRGSLIGGEALQRCAIHDENVGPPVVVIIENGDAGSGCLDDVFLGVHSAENIGHR